MEPDSSATVRLLELASKGDQTSLEKLLNLHTERLSRMVALRMDPRMAGRVDVADVVQEVHVEAWRSLPAYMQSRAQPFYLWLRGVAANKLKELHRRHLGTKMRDARREIPMHCSLQPETSSHVLAALLIDTVTTPSEAAMRVELKERLMRSIDQMDALDREVLTLRHFEQLSPAETSHVLQVSEKAAGMRYLRALKRLKEVLGDLPGGLSGMVSWTKRDPT